MRAPNEEIRLALYGPLGEIVRTIAPHSEADEAGLLFTAMAYAANCIGISPHMYVDARSKHGLRINVVLAGDTANGAKGDTKRAIHPVFEDDPWADNCIQGGFASGEALVGSLASQDPDNYEPRRLIVEEEFASVLVRATREGSILSQIMRAAWDGAPLENRKAGGSQVAHSHLIGVYAHITPTEFRRRLNETETANGFGNRFLVVKVQRAQILPRGGNLPQSEWDRLARLRRDAVRDARSIGTMDFTEAGNELWTDLVYYFHAKPRYGLFGAMTARWRPQLLRMAMLYAALDGQSRVDVDHLLAAQCAWEYVEKSTADIFGKATGDPIADRILVAVTESDHGITRDELRSIVGSRNFPTQRIDDAISLLIRSKDVVKVVEETGGRPRTVYRKPPSVNLPSHSSHMSHGSESGWLPELEDQELL